MISGVDPISLLYPVAGATKLNQNKLLCGGGLVHSHDVRALAHNTC